MFHHEKLGHERSGVQGMLQLPSLFRSCACSRVSKTCCWARRTCSLAPAWGKTPPRTPGELSSLSSFKCGSQTMRSCPSLYSSLAGRPAAQKGRNCSSVPSSAEMASLWCFTPPLRPTRWHSRHARAVPLCRKEYTSVVWLVRACRRHSRRLSCSFFSPGSSFIKI